METAEHTPAKKKKNNNIAMFLHFHESTIFAGVPFFFTHTDFPEK